MAGILLVTGLTLFCAGTLFCMRSARDNGFSPVVFLLPFASLSLVRERWSELWWAAFARLAGVALLLLGIGILLIRDPLILEHPGRIFAGGFQEELAGSRRVDLTSYVSAEEAIRVAIREDSDPELSGRIHGRQFSYDRVQIVDGVMSIRQGSGFLPELEVRILFPDDPLPVRERTSLFVRPGDENPPEVHLSWREPRAAFPETEIIRGGYRMEMQLAPLDSGQLSGFLQLILPDAERSFLSGDFNAFTHNLRYRAGRVDISHDHPDTLEHVAEEFLRGRFPAGAVREMTFSGTRMDSIRGTGKTRVQLQLDDGRIEERVVTLDRADIGWVVRPGAMETRLVRSGDGNDRRPGEADTHEGDVQTIRFDELDRYRGERVTVMRHDRDPRTGVIQGIRDDGLYLEAQVADSTLEFHVTRQELAAVVLQDETQLVLEETMRRVTEQEEEFAREEAGEPSVEVRDEMEEYRKLEGREVRIRSTEGRTRSGRLIRVSDDLLTLEVRVGAGSMEYFFRPDEIESLEVQ